MASQLFSTFTEVGLVDTRVNAGTIQLPKTIDIPYRQISLKDIYGNFQNKSLTLTTQFPDTFEDGTTTKVLSNAFGFTTLYAGLTNVWYMTGGTTLTSQTVSSLTVSSISGSGALLTNLPAISSLSLQSTIAGLGIAGYISTSQLTSTVASLTYGYQTAGFVSTATIVSTTQGLQYAYQTAGFVSSPNLLNHVSTTFLNTSLTSTVAGLGQIYLSTAAAAISQANLNSTVQGLGSATYISSTQLLSTTRSYGTYFTTLSASFSTVYASSGYISSLRVDALQLGAGDGWADFGPLRATSISTLQVQTGALYTTSNFIGSVSSPFNAIQFYGLFGNYNNTVLAEVSTGVGTQELLLFKGSSTSDRIRLQTTGSIVFEPGSSARLWASSITSNVVPAMVIDTNSNVGIKTGTTAGIALDVAGVGRFQTVSTLNIQLSSINGLTFGGPINSTVIGLGSATYVSTTQLTSTVASLVYGYQAAGFLSTTTLTSTVAGLGQNYISTAQLLSTTSGLYTYVTSFVDPTELTSTVVGLGTTGYVSSMGLLSTASGLASYITTFIDPVELASTVTGLGSASFVSTLQLTLNITSTVAGLGSIGYVSTSQLTSTVASVVYGYQTAGFISTATIQSTTSGLQYAYQTAGFVSSPNLLNHVSTTFLNTSLASTVTSLQYAYQTAGFVSSPNLLNLVSTTALNTSLTSTVAGLGQIYLSTAAAAISQANLNSTVQGLGSATYISSTQLLSTTRSYANTFTSLSASFSSVTASNVFASTLIVNNLQIGSGLGWVNIGPIQTVALSTTQVQTGALYATSNFIGSVSTPYNAIQFYGLFGNYNNTVLAEVSTGVGTQELLLFKGSSTSDRIRLQTTGSIVFEPGSSARLWASSITSNVTPAMVIDTNSNVGIKTGTTAGIALDVAGVGRFQTVSTLNIQLSSINGLTFGGPINSTVIGLGTTGYISTATLTSTVAGLLFTGSSISLSTASLFTSSVQASSISVGNGAWLSNTGLYLSNAQAGGAVGQLITNAGFVKLVAASGWSGGYTGFAITGGDLVNKIYMNAGPNAIGGQIAIGGSNPSPGSGSITLDVFGIARFSSISTFQTVASSIGIGIGKPLTPLDVAGMGRFQQLSTLLFNVSSINGFIPWQPSYLQSTVQGLGTAGYISTASLTSTVAALGTASALLVPYSSLNTATYFQLKTSSTQLYYGTVGSTAQVYMGDILAATGNTTVSTPLLLIEQLPIIIPPVTVNYTTPGTSSWTAPTGITSITLVMRGGGGGAGTYASGGNGGLVSGTLAVTPGVTYTIVSAGGGGGTNSGAGGTGGGGTGGNSGVPKGGGGGGGSYFSNGGTLLVAAGGGGGAGDNNFSAAGAGGGTTGGAGANAGGGGTQSAGGAALAGYGSNGSLQQGGNAITGNPGGGGGGGYYGGGAGVGGGGGSSFVTNLTGTVVNTQGGGAAGGFSAQTGDPGTNGSDGSVAITYTPSASFRPGNILEIQNYQLNEIMIDPLLNMGINVRSINSSFQLDVNGAARATSLSTQNIQLSSINGLTFGGPIFSTVIGLGSAGYTSTTSLTSTVRGLGSAGYISTASLTSTVVGLGTAGYISTASLTSTIVGLGTTGYISTASLKSTIIGLGTTGYISTASLTSTVAALGTAAALLVPYSSLNTATYFQLRTSSTQLYYGTFGSTSQVYIGDINSKYGNATLSTPTLLMEQFPIVIPSVASTIGVTYADVTYTVPAGVTSINVELNGAGGGGGSGSGTLSGGAGGRVTGTLAVTPGETLTVVVGIGGTRPTSYYSVVTGYGGGGSAGGISGVGDSGGGGGRSAIRRGGVDIVTAGGGGGAEGTRFYAGGLGGGTTGGSGGGFQDGQGLGGTQTAGGAGGQGANSSAGSLGIGGNASAYGAGFKGAGGGGGGYYGGGSGNSSGSQPGGGGGGSSYVALLTGTVVNTQGGGAAGGTTSIGSNGSVIISIPGYTQTTLGNIIEVSNYLQYKFIIDPSLNVGVNVSSINTNFKLDVNGAIRATSLSTQQIQASSITGISISTQNIQLSSINGLTFGGPIFSTVIGLGSAGYISTASLTSTVRGLGTAGYISTASLVSTFSASGGLFASTVQGLGTAGYISTASLVSTFSASGGLFASTVRGLGTAGYISTASLTSTVAALGTASALLVPYSTLNTTTYFQIKNSTNQLLLGTNGPASQIYIGDVGATYGDSVSTYPTVLIEQTIYQQLNIGSSNYAYASGSDQYFTPPAGVTSVSVVLNGGGGASAPSYTGGSGGYVSGTFPVTPLTQYTIVIGQGGLTGTSGSWGGGGPAGGASSGGGAGRSAIRLSGSDVVTAGGGGGAGAYAGNGGAGGGTTGASGGGTGGGGGGAQTSTPYPGNGGTNSGGGGSSGSGGAAYGSSSGGGGGGYFGGGGAGNQQGGGGGGSSYVANLTGTVVNTQGGGASAGNNGSITISWNFPLIYRNANPLEIRGWQGNKVQIDSYLNMSLSVSSPTSSFRLDVNGIGRMGMPVSSITGTVATFGTTSYGIYYYISNSGFSNITLTSVTAFTGWFVTLRNNTTSYLSVAVTGQTNSTPATPFTIAPSNATTIAYDTNYNSGGTAGYAFF